MYNKSWPRLSDVIAKDDTRPQMNHVYVTAEHIYASDAHILIRLKTSEFFEPHDIEQFPRKGFYLDIYTIRKLQQKNIESVDFIWLHNNFIRIVFEYGEHVYYPWKTVGDVGVLYPDADPIIEKAKKVCQGKIDKIGVKGLNVDRMQRGLGEEYSVTLHFSDPNEPIYVTPTSTDIDLLGREGIIMPVLLQV